MAGDDAGSGQRQQPAPTLPRSTFVLVCVALAGYAVMLAFLSVKRGDDHWDRLVFLFSGVEAIVFAAVGLVFGGVVQRTALHAVEQQADQARGETAAARAEAKQHEGAADDLRALEAMISLAAERERVQQPSAGAELPPGAHGARLDQAGSPAPVAELERFAQLLRQRRTG